MAKVKEVSVQIRGVSYKPNDLHDELDDNSVILLRANNIEDDKVNLNDVVYVDKSRVSDSQYLQTGDILVCASSGSKNLVGKATIIKDDIIATFGAFCKVVRPKSILPQYLGHYFTSPKYRNTISELSAGANINNIRNEHIDSLDIPLPPLETQRQIAANLDKVTHTIDLCNAILEKLDQLVKSRFVEMFGDLMHNPNKWSVYRISDVSTFLKSGLSRKLSDQDIGMPCIRSCNIQNGQFDYSDIKYWYIDDPQGANTNDYILKDGDILINFINSNSQIGKVCIFSDVNRDCIYTTNIFRMILNEKCNKHYFNYYAMTEYYKRQLQNIIQPAVNQSSFTTVNFLKLSIPVPPIELQNQFAAFVEQTDKSKLAVKNVLEKAETLKKALMQEYFG